MYFSCKCNISKTLALAVILKFEMKQSLCMYVCYLHQQGACVHFVICDSSAYHMADKMAFLLNMISDRNLTLIVMTRVV